jgi:signal transduction histidine kinase
MIPAPKPENEEERLRWLKQCEILDTQSEQAYDDLTLLAAQICGVPIALVSLVDAGRQWFKSHHGLAATETPRELAFCAHAILADDLFVVEDASRDSRFADNPLATGDPNVKFYAGAPLILRDNIRLGTLCVIDNKARTLTPQQQQSITALARQAVSLIELRLKVNELQRMDDAKDEFVSMVSHELRTPLTSISGSLSLLRHSLASALEPTPRQMLDIAYRNTERLLNIVNDILELSRLDAGRLELQRQWVDITDLTRQAVDLNRSYCEKCQCSISSDTISGTQTLQVWGDPQRLMQVLTNLISNAAKFTDAGDTLQVSVAREDGHVRVSVTDHGQGIPPEQHTRLFDKFAKIGHVGDKKLPGTGLGLNICKQIVELHGGRIGCDSIPGTRTTFHFTLPLGPADRETSAGP